MVLLQFVGEKSFQKIWNLVRMYLCSRPCTIINIRCVSQLVCEKRLYKLSYSALQNEKSLSVYLDNQCLNRTLNTCVSYYSILAYQVLKFFTNLFLSYILTIYNRSVTKCSRKQLSKNQKFCMNVHLQ